MSAAVFCCGHKLVADSDHVVALEAILKDGVRGTAHVSALASLDGNKLGVLLWHYHDDDVAGPAAA